MVTNLPCEVSLSGGTQLSQPESLISISSAAGETHEHGNGREPERGAAAPGSALPCLFSNNCTSKKDDHLNVLNGAHKRMAFLVAFEIECLVKEFGIERIGFFTLTFKDHVTDLREAQKRFRSIRAHVIVKRYQRAIGVWERHESKRIHFHLVVVLDKDILTGADFAAFKRKDYRSANSALRAEWSFWRQTCPKYRFGRHELMPVKSNAKGISRYVGKYISKHVGQRLPQDKGARVVRFIGYKSGMRRGCCRFSWNTTNGWLWRHKAAAYAKRFDLTDIGQMKMIFGSRWAYRLQDQILAECLNDTIFPSRAAAERSLDQTIPMLLAHSRAEHVIEEMPVVQTRLLREEKFDSEIPVWAVPEWFGEKPEMTRPNAVEIRQAEENAVEMKLYAMRMPFMRDPGKIGWLE